VIYLSRGKGPTWKDEKSENILKERTVVGKAIRCFERILPNGHSKLNWTLTRLWPEPVFSSLYSKKTTCCLSLQDLRIFFDYKAPGEKFYHVPFLVLYN
jgi:hypothetical protein